MSMITEFIITFFAIGLIFHAIKYIYEQGKNDKFQWVVILMGTIFSLLSSKGIF